jgi:hypothetical protein
MHHYAWKQDPRQHQWGLARRLGSPVECLTEAPVFSSEPPADGAIASDARDPTLTAAGASMWDQRAS